MNFRNISRLTSLPRKDFLRTIRHLMFLPRGLATNPNDSSATTSDLFPIRNNDSWTTQFELLNVRGLIQGYSAGISEEVQFYFFSSNGEILGKQNVSIGANSRNSIPMPPKTETFKSAASFAVFHSPVAGADLKGSILAERGYSGYGFDNKGLKGYVHGNLDALALKSDGQLMCLGNKGLISRRYLVQHVLRGPALYEFFITNPAKHKVSVTVKVRDARFWKKYMTVSLPSRGIQTISIRVGENESKVVKFVSKLYMCRPVVFRTTEGSMDVFHG